MQQNIRLVFDRGDGSYCPILKAKIEAGQIQGLALALFSVEKYLPGLKMVVNDHLLTGLIISHEGCTLRGIALSGGPT